MKDKYIENIDSYDENFIELIRKFNTSIPDEKLKRETKELLNKLRYKLYEDIRDMVDNGPQFEEIYCMPNRIVD